MPCCTCSRSRTRPACRSPSTTSRASAAACRCWRICGRAGRYSMSDLIRIGGIQPLMRTLLDAGLLHGDCLTVTGRTLAPEPARASSRYPAGQRHHSTARRPDQARQPPRRAVRQPRARRRGRKDHRQGRSAASRDAHGCSTARRRRCRRSSTASWSSRRRRRRALRRAARRAGHARDAEPDRGDHGPGSGRQGRAHHRRALLRRQPRLRRRSRLARGRTSAGRSRWCATATGSRSMPCGARSVWRSTPRSSMRAGAAGSAPAPYATRGVLAKYAQLVSSASLGAVTDR